jgi:hypothetical protein
MMQSNLTTHAECIAASNQAEISEIQFKILASNIRKIRDVVSQISSEHRDLHGTVSKVGKAIDRNFVSDFAAVANETLYDEPDKRRILNHAIVEHFMRQGQLDIADQLIREAELRVSAEAINPFTELNHILDSLKCRKLGPALEWAARNRDALIAKDSNLEFKLHRLQFIENMVLWGSSKQSDLIAYARANLQQLAERHEKEFQSLMGSLLYLRCGLEKTVYSYFLDPANWTEICEVFTRDACNLLGLSVESPLAVAFDAGCVCLPALLNIRKVMQQRQVSLWQVKEELPIEIELGRSKQFHSIFACPIPRQQSSELNPPMRLVCGHVISKEALQKLAQGTAKLKCPYCPLEQAVADARQIFF